MVMLAPSTAAPCAERPRAGPAWARLPLERAARYSPAEDATSPFSGSTGVKGTYLDEVLMMRNAAGTKYYYHTNHLYSVHAITNQSGAIVEAVGSYDAYGKPTILTGAGTDATWFTGDDVVGSVSAIGNPWFYTGQRLDAETGLMYYKNRYYSVELGRFVSRDPIGYEGDHNLYCLVQSRPIFFFDPFGLRPKTKEDEERENVDRWVISMYRWYSLFGRGISGPSQFPNLDPEDLLYIDWESRTESGDPYNCYECGIDLPPDDLRPHASRRDHDAIVAAVKAWAQRIGYDLSKPVNCDCECGKEKIAVYFVLNVVEPRVVRPGNPGFIDRFVKFDVTIPHIAKQLSDCTWESKMGDLGPYVIHRHPDDLAGNLYGFYLCFERKK